MQITRKIDTTNAKYDLTDLSHQEIMRIYQGLTYLYSHTWRKPIDEVEEDLPKKLCKIIRESQITI